MRKIGAVLLSSAISIAMVTTSFSADTGLTSGKTVNNTQNNISIKVNGTAVKSDVSPVIVNDRTLVPARAIFEQLGAQITWDGKTRQVGVALGEYKILLTIDNKKALVNDKNVEMDVPAQILNNRTLIPLRFVGEQLNMKVSWNAAEKLVTVDYKKDGDVMAELDDIIYTSEGKNDKVTTPTLKPTNTPIPTPTHTPSATEKPSGSPSPTNSSSQALGDSGNIDIKFSLEDNKEMVMIGAESFQGYTVARYTDPDRIAVDIPNAKTSKDQQTINVNGKYIKKIRYAMFDEKTARVVLDVSGQVQFKCDVEDGKLVVRVDPPIFKNVVYDNMGDRVGLTIKGATLTEGGENLKKHYTGTYSENDMVYTITFPSGKANLDTGIMYIDDKYLKSIEIKKDSSKNTTSIIFTANEKFVYNVFSRASLNDTAITILKPALPGEKLIVIDPGHGGSEPGAESFGTKEKTFNLDISMRLDKLLKQAGIRSYIIREEDIYVGLYERAYIANDLNATLFLSIHNNAYYSATKGTETLYYPNRSNSKGFTSKRFAQIIQDNLISTLKTTNRGLVERPNLVVLKATKMPAALAEIAFMTNKDDFALLQSESFRQKTAEALYKAIVQSFNEIG